MEDDNKADLSSLLEVNRLDYRLPPSLSIATSRSMKTFRSAKHTHVMGIDQVDFQLSSGAAYVDLLNSFISFEVKFDAPAAMTDIEFPAHAGFANMIQGYRIIHSSGVELDRQNDAVGEYIQIKDYYDCSKASRRTKGSLYRLNDKIHPTKVALVPNLHELRAGLDIATLGSTDLSGRSYRVVIPLATLAPIFNNDLLAPSFLTAGLRIELLFHTPQHFFVKDTAWPAGSSVLINRPEIHLESFQLTDSITRKLSQISASSGLEWYWDAVHHMSNIVSESEVTIQVTRALSRANNIMVKSRSNANMNNQKKDSLASLPWNYNETDVAAALPLEQGGDGTLEAFQVQLGAQFMPSQPIQHVEQFLHSAYKTFSQMRRSDEVGGPELGEFTGIKEVQGAADKESKYVGGLAIAAIPLESSSTLQQSGSAISAQRTAVVNLAFKTSPLAASTVAGAPLFTTVNDSRRIDLLVEHSKLCTLFLDSCVVRS